MCQRRSESLGKGVGPSVTTPDCDIGRDGCEGPTAVSGNSLQVVGILLMLHEFWNGSHRYTGGWILSEKGQVRRTDTPENRTASRADLWPCLRFAPAGLIPASDFDPPTAT